MNARQKNNNACPLWASIFYRCTFLQLWFQTDNQYMIDAACYQFQKCIFFPLTFLVCLKHRINAGVQGRTCAHFIVNTGHYEACK